MKLYMFDYCSHCQMTNMVAKYKGLLVNNVILQYHDLTARERMANSSTVPILEKPDGSYMAESMDIAHYFDHLSDKRIILPPSYEDETTEWLEDITYYYRRLTFPRIVKLKLPEFRDEKSIECFTKNKEAMIGMTFEEALTNTADWKKAVDYLLGKLTFLTPPAEFNNQISWDDVRIFPILRNLTMVKDLYFPKELLEYMNQIASLCSINLYFNRAI